MPTRAPLVDRFGRRHNYLRVSLTDRCNFRCVYCMPKEIMEWTPRSEILSFEEIERLVRLFAELGIDKVRLTGGEPTVRKGVVDIVEKVASVDGVQRVLMTTNGEALEQLAAPLRAAGLSGLNVSLDTLRRDRFLEITQRDKLDKVLAGINAALEEDFESVKINVVAMLGANSDELVDFVRYFQDQFLEIRFIEFMPFLANGWHRAQLLPYSEMLQILEQHYRLIPRGVESSAVAKEFDVEGARVRLGFITSMTDSFCGGCNRIRLTADGRLKVCLFSKTGPSLRDAMRAGASDDELEMLIREALDGKWAAHPPMTQLVEANDRPMIAIGG